MRMRQRQKKKRVKFQSGAFIRFSPTLHHGMIAQEWEGKKIGVETKTSLLEFIKNVAF